MENVQYSKKETSLLAPLIRSLHFNEAVDSFCTESCEEETPALGKARQLTRLLCVYDSLMNNAKVNQALWSVLGWSVSLVFRASVWYLVTAGRGGRLMILDEKMRHKVPLVIFQRKISHKQVWIKLYWQSAFPSTCFYVTFQFAHKNTGMETPEMRINKISEKVLRSADVE